MTLELENKQQQERIAALKLKNPLDLSDEERSELSRYYQESIKISSANNKNKSVGLSDETKAKIAAVRNLLGPKAFRKARDYNIHAFFTYANTFNCQSSMEAEEIWHQFLENNIKPPEGSSNLWTAKVWSTYPESINRAQIVYQEYEQVFEKLISHKASLPLEELSKEDELIVEPMTIPEANTPLDETLKKRYELGHVLRTPVLNWVITM